MSLFIKQSQVHLAGQIASVLLAAWVFVLTLAGVSPVLHEWLHADSGCAGQCEHSEENSSEESPEHFCGVLTLQSGAISTHALEVPKRLTHQSVSLAIVDEIIASTQVEQTQHARAPPFEVIA